MIVDYATPTDATDIVRHATSLARVGGLSALSRERVAHSCGLHVTDLPIELQNDHELRVQVSRQAAIAFSRHIGVAVRGVHDGVELLRQIGRAYISFALDEPGWFELAIQADAGMANARSEAARCDGKTTYEHLEHAFTTLVGEGRVAPGDVTSASMTCWSGVHGFAVLVTRGPLSAADPAAILELSQQIVDQLVYSTLEFAPSHRDAKSA